MVAEMTIIQEMYGHMRLDIIWNEVIINKEEVAAKKKS